MRLPKLEVVRLGADFSVAGGAGHQNGEHDREVEKLIKCHSGSYLLAVGTLEPRKNIGCLLDAFDELSADLPKLALVLVGREGWMVKDLVSRLESHPLLGGRLRWLRSVGDGDASGSSIARPS